ncbi:unnamed protein product [Ranitomeya imitator]|uniref:VWFA domain-containing protein n=1 Tax=Ranitomeya imitator TaxID=111125 RepID=A0ABN9LG55_9NEOB|nr:unnamed protein product [Ranitomeya imitator]
MHGPECQEERERRRKGVVKHLQFQPKELEEYIEQLEKTLKRYIQRLQWLLSGSRRLFGTISEDKKGFTYPDVKGVYLLTDGKPDISYNLLQAEHLLKSRNIKVHTVSFNSSERSGNEFLKTLAALSGGRYHSRQGDTDGHFVAHRMLTEGFSDEDDPVLPVFEGDDLKRLAKEIDRARRFVTQARSFRTLIMEKQMSASGDASLDGSDVSGHYEFIDTKHD